MVLDQKWVGNSISDVKIEFGHIWSLNATIFESVDKNGFSHFSRALWNFKCDDLLIHVTQASYHGQVWRLSFHWKKINVSRQKLIENERNEILKLFNFFQKEWVFFKFWKSPEKNSSRSCFFFEKFIQLQNCLESLQIIFRTFWRYLWKGLTSHLTILRL